MAKLNSGILEREDIKDSYMQIWDMKNKVTRSQNRQWFKNDHYLLRDGVGNEK